MSGVTVNGDKRVGSDIGDGHASGKGRACYSERRNVEEILTALRVGVETEYSVIAEPSSEDEDIIAFAAIAASRVGS